MKTDRQVVLELQHSRPIVQIVRKALEEHRGKKSQVTLAALDLGITDATVYNWCEDLGIDIDEYRDRPRRAKQEEALN